MKYLLFAALMAVSSMVSANGAAYMQAVLDGQEIRTVSGKDYVGMNPTEDRVFTVTTFDGGAVALVSMLTDGTSHEIYSGLRLGDTNWADLYQWVSSETRRTHGYLEDAGNGELYWYIEWCTSGEADTETYTPFSEWIEGQVEPKRTSWVNWLRRILSELPELFTREIGTEETGCPVSSRRYIVLEQIQ